VRDGTIRRVTDDPADETTSSWSRDGRHIYYTSSKTGRPEIYRIPAAGGLPLQITKHGGVHGLESADRKSVYYAKALVSPTAIWKVDILESREAPVVEGLSDRSNFVPVVNGIYFLSVGTRANDTAIEFYDFATGRRKLLSKLGKPWKWGIAISPDRQSLLYSVVDHASSNLMLVENFQ
jgi:hypothetical protein